MKVKILVPLLILFFLISSQVHGEYPDRDKWNNSSYSLLFNDSAFRILYGGDVELTEAPIPMLNLARLDADQLRLLRNAIFAKHGYQFRSNDLNAFFERYSWYQPNSAFNESMLTPVEKKNVERIQVFEDAYQATETLSIPTSNLVGIWQGSPMMASGWSDRLEIFPDGRINWVASQMFGAKRLLQHKGRWSISGHMLVFTVLETEYIKDGQISEEPSPIDGFWIEPSTVTTKRQNPPLVFLLPISAPFTWEHDELGKRHAVELGGSTWFRMEENPNNP